MKINVEFNTVEEMKEFAELIGVPCKGNDKMVAVVQNEEKEVKNNNSKEDKKKMSKKLEKTKLEEKPKEEPVQEEAPKVEAEKVGVDETPIGPHKDAEFTEEGPKITKEQLREICSSVMKSGKQSEVKEIFKKYGASKLPELKEEDYASAYKDVEALQ